MSARRFLLPSVILYAALHGISYGQAVKLIGVNFMGRQNTDNDGVTMNTTETAGVNLVPSGGPNLNQSNWNNVETDHPWDGFIPNTVGSSSGIPTDGGNNAANYTTNTLRDSNAGATPVTFTITNANDQWNTPNADYGGQTNDAKMFYGLYKRQNVGTAMNFTFNNLLDFAVTETLYEVIVYYSVNGTDNDDGSGGGRKMDLVITGGDGASGTSTQSRFVREQIVNLGAPITYVEGVSTNSAARDATSSNFARFIGLKAYDLDGAGAGTIFGIKIDAFNQATNDGIGVAGIQLRQITPLNNPKVWTGSVNGNWDLATTNWNLGGPTTFSNGDAVLFNDTGANKTITVDAGGVSIAQITVDNTVGGGAYTISGGAISGDGGLIKRNTGVLNMTGVNTFIGNVELREGTVNVPTIGGPNAPGALGRGAILQLGAVGTAATLNYTGVANETINRSLTTAGGGGGIVIPGGVVVTFNGGLDGSGDLVKAGPGNLRIVGGGTNAGNLTVLNGLLEVTGLGSGVGKTVTLGDTSTQGRVRFAGGALNDARGLSVSAGGGIVDVAANSSWSLAGPASIGASPFTKTGAGRLALAGPANLSTMPIIAEGILALTAAAGNVLPATLTVPSGTLELGPGSFTDGTPIVLSGGAVRLGHLGLQARYHSFGYDQGAWVQSMSGTVFGIDDAFLSIGTPPNYIAPTTTGGQTNLDFRATNPNIDAAPFGNQGYLEQNDIRVQFPGKIYVPTAGVYTFYMGSDDGTAVFLDGVRVVNNNFFQGHTVRSGTITLTPGLHDILMYFYEGGGGASMVAEWEGPGIGRQAIPNIALYGGDTLNAPGTNVTVSSSSTLEVMHQTANLGALTQAGGTTLTVIGSASFSGTTVSGVGSPTLDLPLPLSNVNLGTLSAPAIINKNGPGALVFSSPVPAATSINLNNGLVVIAGSESGGVTTNPLANGVINFNGGGLGLSTTSGSPTYTTNITAPGSWRLEAGRFGVGVATPTLAAIQYNPASGNLTVATGQTGSIRVRETNYVLNIGASIGGAGTIVAEEGTINFNGATFTPGAFTVGVANATVNAPINSGPITVTGTFNGVTPHAAFGTLTANGTVQAPAITVSGGTLNGNGSIAVAGNFNVSGGTANLVGGTTVAGTLNVTGGTVNLGGNNNVLGAISQTGTGTLNVSSNTAVAGGTTVGNGRTLNFTNFGTLNFASNINVDQGTVRAATGNTDLGANAIQFTAFSFGEGLREGFAPFVDNNLANPANRGIVDRPRMGETSAQPNDQQTGWGFNETWVYSGQFFDADGVFAFAENIDDNTRVVIDNVTVLANDNWEVATSTGNLDGEVTNNGSGPRAGANQSAKIDGFSYTHNYGMGPDGDGWHSIKILFAHGGGGAGTVGNFGWAGGNNGTYDNKGFGLNSNPQVGTPTSNNGGNYIIPVETMNGTPELFRLFVGGGSVVVEGGASLRAGGLGGASEVIVRGGSTFGLNPTAVPTSDLTYRIEATGSGTLDIGTNHQLDTKMFTVSATSAIVTKLGEGTLRITDRVTSAPNSTFAIQNGLVLFDSPSVSNPGNLSTTLAGGAVGGVGKVPGALSVSIGGTVAPGSPQVNGGMGELGVLGNLEINGGFLSAELRTLGTVGSPDYDRLNVTGTIDITGSTLNLTVMPGFNATAGALFFLAINDGSDAVISTFTGLPDGASFVNGGQSFRISYDASFEGTTLDGGNDIALQYIPEPGAIAMLLGGFGALLGFQRVRRRK